MESSPSIFYQHVVVQMQNLWPLARPPELQSAFSLATYEMCVQSHPQSSGLCLFSHPSLPSCFTPLPMFTKMSLSSLKHPSFILLVSPPQTTSLYCSICECTTCISLSLPTDSRIPVDSGCYIICPWKSWQLPMPFYQDLLNMFQFYHTTGYNYH